MGDYWNVGTVVMMVSFLGLFALIAPIISNDFLWSQASALKQRTVEDYDWWDLESYRYRLAHNLTYGLGENWYDFNTANPSYPVKCFIIWFFDKLILYRVTWELLIWRSTTVFRWEQPNVLHVHKADLVNRYADNMSKFKPVYNGFVSFLVAFADRNITRNDMSLAWDTGQLTCELAFGPLNVTQTYSSWDLVAKFLFFQTYDIFGSDFIWINTLIALPLWSAIVYLVIRITLLFIPFLGG